MKPASMLSLTESQHAELRRHLFPGDGLEASAILLCSRTPAPRVRFIVRDQIMVPHDACKRERDYLSWPGKAIAEAVSRAEADKLALVLTHSHPGGLFGFSDFDDRSDQVTIGSLLHGYGTCHATAIMTPVGAMAARWYGGDLAPHDFDAVSVVGHDLRWWWRDEAFKRRPLAFTSEATDELSRLSVCVIGVSGTGSPVAEQLARMGFGRVILIDHDRVEKKNLNRILNSTLEDAKSERHKVDMMSNAISLYRGDGVAVPLAASITERESVLLASQADILCSCVDTLDARHIADEIAASFCMPLFDVGVTIPTRKTAGGNRVIADVCGRIDYVQPGGATLRDRGVYSPESLREEYLRRAAPEAHAEEVNAGYLRGVREEAPSVIALNMRAASACVMELVARVYPFRHDPNERFARTQFSLAAGEEIYTAESQFKAQPNRKLGRGAAEPLLGLPSFRPAKRTKGVQA
ncbi:ThiF family adenylyltransferase [Hydrogenophaga sp. OTU3427]|uniref:ThiF family adenylyltransferase n=1 Tax=Hydrogenophaga sp. OTU3427 TaxID=3043856 RepID=UPI00313C557E